MAMRDCLDPLLLAGNLTRTKLVTVLSSNSGDESTFMARYRLVGKEGKGRRSVGKWSVKLGASLFRPVLQLNTTPRKLGKC